MSLLVSRGAACAVFFVISAWLLIGSSWASAQAPSALPGHVHSTWTTENGLPQNVVLTLAQTRDRYLWIGTGNGLARFDGVTFRVFDMLTTPELPSGWISALHEDPEGTLWIGTDLGLVEYRAGIFTRRLPDTSSTSTPTHITHIQTDREGRLLVATPSRVLRRDGDTWTTLLDAGDHPFTLILVDAEGVLWIGTHNGLIRWNGQDTRRLTASDGLPAGLVSPLLADSDGNLWVRGFPGFARIDRRTGIVHQAPEAMRSAHVFRMAEAADGIVWAVGNDTLFALDRTRPVSTYRLPAGPAAEIAAILIDDEQRLWLGLSGGPGGLHRLNPRRVEVVAHEEGLPCDNAVPVLQAPDGTIWSGISCGDSGGLVSIRDGRVTHHRSGPGRAPVHVASLLAPPDGGLWIGTFGGGLAFFDQDRFTWHRPEPLARSNIVALQQDRDGALWVGSDHGLSRWHEGQWTHFTTADGLVHDDVRVLHIDADGALWVGTSGGLSRYANGRFDNLTPADGLPPGAVRAVHVDEDRVVWIGTRGGGLARLKNGRLVAFGTQDDLLDASVHRILEDDSGDLWMSGDRGIRRVRRADLNDVADGISSRLSVDLFDTRDGMKSEEANGFGHPAGWRMTDGSLWFPTQGGLVRIDPDAVDRNTRAPAVVVEAVRIGGRAYDSRRPIVVAPGSTELEIEYTAPAFLRPELLQFQYRLHGHDSDWIDAGPRRVAHYVNLAPGSYRFEVMARGGAGIWSAEAALVEMAFEPSFHQRRTVQTAALVLLAVAMYGTGRWRAAHLRRRAKELEATVVERTEELRRDQARLEQTNERLGEAMDETHRAKDAVEAAHVHLLAVFDHLRTGVLVVDAQARILFASEAMTRLVTDGLRRPLVGRTLDDVLAMSPVALDEVRAAIAAPGADRRATLRLEPVPGEQFWAELEVRVDPRDHGHRILYFYDVTEISELKRATGVGHVGRQIAGTSAAIRDVVRYIAMFAGVSTTVLIEGETGTGKERVARAIHDASPRRAKRFVAINCAGLTESILASQLFGHRRGAFTGAVADHAGLFEAAQGGTLLLDEIGDMPVSMQTHLLRVLQEHEIVRVGDTKPRPIDVRVLASTHRNLEAEVAAGRFREDLFYRIRVARLVLPPLRQRPEDIPLLVAEFVEQHAAKHGKTIQHMSREAMEQLCRHSWPGNTRELSAAVERSVVHATGPIIRPSDLPPETSLDDLPPARGPLPADERRELVDALKRARGNRSEAARLLGISRATLYRRLASIEGDDAASQSSN